MDTFPIVISQGTAPARARGARGGGNRGETLYRLGSKIRLVS